MSFLTVASPADNGLPRDVSSILLLKDLDKLLPVPQAIPAGTYAFTVSVAAQSRQDLTNPASGVYTAILGGIAFSLPKAGGNVTVNVPVTPGKAIRLQHVVNYDNIDMRSILDSLFGSAAVITVPSLASATAMELITPKIQTVSPTGGWTPSTASNVCSNPVNAIRAVIATVAQSALLIDNSSLATAGEGNITFARPNSYRIIAGYYSVTFSVNLNGYGGYVSLKIGDTIVFVADAGNVIYQWSPATISFDQDVDVLPMKLEGGIGSVVATITAASRTVSTGNLDSSLYATLAYPSTRYFRALQTTQNPNLGKIKRVRLAIEWFGNGIIPVNTCRVKWAGRVLGYLSAQSVGGGTLNRTITVDVISQGAAALPSQTISTTVSGGTAALNHNTLAQQQTVSSAVAPLNTGTGTYLARGWSASPTLNGWDSSLGSITVEFIYVAAAAVVGFDYTKATLKRANGTDILAIASTSGASSVATKTWKVTATINEMPTDIYWEAFSTNPSAATMVPASVNLKYNAKITQSAASLSNTPASGSSSPLPAQSLGNSGIAVNTSGGSITFTVPEAPRTTITEFDLPDVTEWDQMTGKTTEVELLASSPSVQLVQVQLVVDYDKVTYAVPANVTASARGLSGNPADIISFLSDKLDEDINARSLRTLRTWAENNNYMFARFVSSSSDAWQLRLFALNLCNAFLANTSAGMKVIRLLDLSTDITDIEEDDLLMPSTISWSERVETQITLRYAEDYAAGFGFLKTLEANDSNNVYCYRGKKANLVDTPIIIEAGFIRDDQVAALYLADYCRLYGQPSRILSIKIPYVYATLEEGDLIRYDNILYRINVCERRDIEIDITAYEVPPV